MNFFISFIRQLLDEGHTVDIATNESSSKVPACYKEWGCTVYQIGTSRSPLDKGNVKAVKQIKEIVGEKKYDIVHCHTPVAAMCTRIACRKARKKGTKVFYTAHGFHFYKGAPLKNWLLYYPVEKICANFTDVLITINQEDYALAQKKMKAKQVEYVPGVGIDVDKFAGVVIERAKKRRELDIPKDAFLMISVGELNENKNHKTIIKAMGQFGNKNIYYAIAGKGELDDELIALADELGLGERLKLLGFRSDVAELYKASDVCVFPSIREGLGLAAIEAMACGLPLIAADNRGTRDFCVDGVNALVSQATDVNKFASCIEDLYKNKSLRGSMARYNIDAAKKFEVKQINESMKEIYKVN